MDLLSSIKDHHSERRLFISRVILTSVVSFLLLSTVIARLIQLQVYDHEAFAAQSQGNRIRIEPVPPIRGLVFDRRGRVLAENLVRRTRISAEAERSTSGRPSSRSATATSRDTRPR